ncbi:MAG: hypothetical protein K2G51_12330 [Lachnospiraceae bacterium]|nr:hypothetical protein [Lachnospiraceae bacterium]
MGPQCGKRLHIGAGVTRIQRLERRGIMLMCESGLLCDIGEIENMSRACMENIRPTPKGAGWLAEWRSI